MFYYIFTLKILAKFNLVRIFLRLYTTTMMHHAHNVGTNLLNLS